MSSTRQIFSINGLIDTNKNIWQNVETIAAASAAWVTWDPFSQKFGVVINEPGASVRSFNDDNIIGSISITETPFEDQYNSCEVSFPNRDLVDRVDYIRYDAPTADRFDNEPDNMLSIQSDIINDPVQADVIAITELKQSRQNKVITFATDFTNLDLSPGDVIDVTNEYWGWSAKEFRIVTMEEEDLATGEIVVKLTCIEYSDEVYNYDGIVRQERSTQTGIPSFPTNTDITTIRSESIGQDVGDALGTTVGKDAIVQGGLVYFDSLVAGWTKATFEDFMYSATPADDYLWAWLTLAYNSKNVQIIIEGAYGDITYDVDIGGTVESRTVTANVPQQTVFQYAEFSDFVDEADARDKAYQGGPSDPYVTLTTRDTHFGNGYTVYNLTDAPAGYYRIRIFPIDTLDLNQTSASEITITAIDTVEDSEGLVSKLSVVILE